MKKLRHDRRGAAMILVLCVMALLMALCLSLLYGVAQISANAEKRVQQVQARQLAQSFSDTLRDSLIGSDGQMNTSGDAADISNILQHFLSSSSYVPFYWYSAELEPESLPDGCTGVTVSMEKSKVEVPELFNVENPAWVDPTNDSYFGYLDIRVTVQMRKTSVSVVYHYEFQPDFTKLSYYYKNGSLLELVHTGGQYLDKRDNTALSIGVDEFGEPIYVTDALVIQDTGSVQGSDLVLYSGFLSEPIPYRLSWQGEV